MTVNKSSMLGWKKIERVLTSRFGVVEKPAARNASARALAVSILAAYDVPQEVGRLEAEPHFERTMCTALIKRAQILQ